MDTNVKMSKNKETTLTNVEQRTIYRRLIGQLLYLQISRPGLCFAIHRLSRFLQKSTNDHLKCRMSLVEVLEEVTRTRHFNQTRQGIPPQG